MAAEGGPLGAKIDLATGLRPDVTLFNESQSRAVVTVSRANATSVLSLLEWRGIPVRRLGEVTSGDTLDITADGKTFSWKLDDLHTKWADTIGSLMED